MTPTAITALARRHKLTAAGESALAEEYQERLAVSMFLGGLSEEEASVVALEDCERYAAGLVKGGGHG